MKITIYTYVFVHLKTQHVSYATDSIMHTVHHISLIGNGVKTEVKWLDPMEKLRKLILLKAFVWICGLKHLSFLLGGKGCCLNFIRCSMWYGGSTRTDTPNMDEFSILKILFNQ